MSVASFVPDDENCIIVALLHDVVEDTDVTLKDLEEEFSSDVLEALCCMTHDKSEPYNTYVARVSKNPIAKQVKLADLKHNMDLTRLPNPSEIDLKRLEVKYKPALAFLTGEISEEEYLK